MKTKPFFGLMLLFMMVQLTFSQSKTFNGKFNSTNFQGYVTYNYTEQQDKRNFNGIFIFKTANNSVNISGNFLNDFKNGKWNSPVNFGPDVNTQYNETCPAIGYDRTFYNVYMIFSSDRPGGKGGYDLYFKGI